MEERDFFITGIQQVGVGTTSVYDSWKWFIKMFGVDIRVLEDDTVAERMLPYTGGHPRKRHAAIAINLQGGGGFEIWQYSERKPQPVGRPNRTMWAWRAPTSSPASAGTR